MTRELIFAFIATRIAWCSNILPNCYVDTDFYLHNEGGEVEGQWGNFCGRESIQQNLKFAAKNEIEKLSRLELPIKLVYVHGNLQAASFDFPLSLDGSTRSAFDVLELVGFPFTQDSLSCATSNVEQKWIKIGPLDTDMIKVCRRHNLSTESCKELQQNQETNTRKPFYVERIPFTVNHSSIISIDEFQIDVGPFDNLSSIVDPLCQLHSLSEKSCRRLQNEVSLKNDQRCHRTAPMIGSHNLVTTEHSIQLYWSEKQRQEALSQFFIRNKIPITSQRLLKIQLEQLIQSNTLRIPIRYQNESTSRCLVYDDINLYHEAFPFKNKLCTRRSVHHFSRLLQNSRGIPWNNRPQGQTFDEYVAKRVLAKLSRRNTHANEFKRILQAGKLSPPTAFGPSPISTSTEGSFMITSNHKLQHDEEQLRYLMEKSLLPTEFQVFAEALRGCRSIIEKSGPSNQLMTPELYDKLGEVYNTVVYLPSGPPTGSIYEAINPNLNFQAISDAYFSHSGYGVAVIDDFLTQPALDALIKYCNEATIFYEVKAGYLGAYHHRGLAIDLFSQIEDELRFYFPEILADHALKNLWAYKYDGDLGGIRIHADDAAVNFNFWITSNDANLNPDTGGLVVYTKAAPLNQELEQWNSDDENRISAMYEFIQRSKAEPTNIPYRQNRAVLFNSNLLHESAPFTFKKGYTNRRINLTMLFGNRQSHPKDTF